MLGVQIKFTQIWSWGNLVWINFNDATGSLSGPQYYEFDSDNWELTGYAYSENYSYIKFGDLVVLVSPDAFSNSTFAQNQKGGSLNCNAHLLKKVTVDTNLLVASSFLLYTKTVMELLV